jgi:hypothetical protein
MRHSEGKWQAGSHRTLEVRRPNGKLDTIGAFYSGACESLEECDANEALCAAAPDLQRDAIIAAGLLNGAAAALEIAGQPRVAQLLRAHFEQIVRTVEQSRAHPVRRMPMATPAPVASEVLA